jgi:formylglycine-generating enzyme required for sulfatase activity
MARRLVSVATGVAAIVLVIGLGRADDRPPRKVAFLVGVAKYDHDFRDLDYAEWDVEELGTTLREGGFEVVRLTGAAAGRDRATKKNVKARLADLLAGNGDETKKIRKGDLVLVALSGHGLQMRVPDPANPTQTKEAAFFCPVNAKRNDPNSLVSLSHLLDDLLAPTGGRNLLLVDACRDIAEPNKGKGIEGRDMALRGETAVLFSCGRGERSWENADLKHGLFTHAVLRGLRGDAARNGVVTWSALVNSVREEMASDEFRKLVPAGFTQTPIPTSGQLPRTVLLAAKAPAPAPDRGTPTPSDAGRVAGARPQPLDCTGPNGVKAADVKAAQAAWAKYLGRQVEEEDEIAPGVKMTFVLIPPGKFLMGSPREEQDYVTRTYFNGKRPDDLDRESPQHEVTLTKPFYLGKYEATQAQYQAVTGSNPSHFKGADNPVELATWEEADAFAGKLSEKSTLKHLYRLPREAEWEYSCRGGRPSSQPFGVGDGRSLSATEANFNGNYPYGGAAKGAYLEKTARVGSYPANGFGLNDMHGNVWEWCADWYGAYPSRAVTDPIGPSEGSDRVFRGGSGGGGAGDCRAANRSGGKPGYRDVALGFRLARVPSGQAQAPVLAAKAPAPAPDRGTRPASDAGRVAGARPQPLDCTGPNGVKAADVKVAQTAWAKYLGRQVEEEDEVAPGVKMTFVLIPPGKILMGSPAGETNRGGDEAQHAVTLTKPFYLGKYELTQAQYEAVTGSNPSEFKGADNPVENVTWKEADAFAGKLSEKSTRKHLYRLPTEAEWEYSCRGGRPSSQPFGVGVGRSLSATEANFIGEYPYGAATGPSLGRTCRVGSYRPNALGLFDMHGNVWEWCADRYEKDYPSRAVTDPVGPSSGSDRVARGGGWYDDAGVCRAAVRSWFEPGVRSSGLGFRLARVPSGLGQ